MQCVTDLWQMSRGCRGFVEGPWKTHQALLLTSPRALRSYLTRSLSTGPMKIPPITHNSVFPVMWSECVKLSDSHSFRQPDRRLPGDRDLDPDLTQQLALEYTDCGLVHPKPFCCRPVKLNRKNGRNTLEGPLI